MTSIQKYDDFGFGLSQLGRVGNVFLLPTTFLMRKVGKKRTLPTLHDLVW